MEIALYTALIIVSAALTFLVVVQGRTAGLQQRDTIYRTKTRHRKDNASGNDCTGSRVSAAGADRQPADLVISMLRRTDWFPIDRITRASACRRSIPTVAAAPAVQGVCRRSPC